MTACAECPCQRLNKDLDAFAARFGCGAIAPKYALGREVVVKPCRSQSLDGVASTVAGENPEARPSSGKGAEKLVGASLRTRLLGEVEL